MIVKDIANQLNNLIEVFIGDVEHLEKYGYNELAENKKKEIEKMKQALKILEK